MPSVMGFLYVHSDMQRKHRFIQFCSYTVASHRNYSFSIVYGVPHPFILALAHSQYLNKYKILVPFRRA